MKNMGKPEVTYFCQNGIKLSLIHASGVKTHNSHQGKSQSNFMNYIHILNKLVKRGNSIK